MASVITVLVFIGISIAIVAYALCISSSESDDKVLVIHKKNIVEKYNNSISGILDKLQLLLSECHMSSNDVYIMDMFDIIVALNNKYICNKEFDTTLITKLLALWYENEGSAKAQLINFDDINNEFKSLKGIMNSINRQMYNE